MTQKGFSTRLSSLATLPFLFALGAVYATLIYLAAFVRYADFLFRSVSLGEWGTVGSVFAAVLRDLVPSQHAVVWLLALLLLAVDFTLVAFYFRRIKRNLPETASLGGFGFLVFALGLACLSCGAALSALLVSVVGAAALPFLVSGGGLFLWGGLAVLAFLTGFIFKKVTDPFVC